MYGTLQSFVLMEQYFALEHADTCGTWTFNLYANLLCDPGKESTFVETKPMIKRIPIVIPLRS
jgi:hypothetical protein